VPVPPPPHDFIALFLTDNALKKVKEVRLKRDIGKSLEIAAQFVTTTAQVKSLKTLRRVEVYVCVQEWCETIALEGEEPIKAD
jgi:hypothetical protein